MALDFPNPAGQTPANTFSPTSTPSASTNGVTYVWDGEKWVAQAGSDGGGTGSGAVVHYEGPTPPSTVTLNVTDQWFNTNDGRLYTLTENENGDKVWIDASPPGSGGGGVGGESGGGSGTVGTIVAWANSTVPTGWLECDGSPIPSQYSELIALIGANTPDLRGEFVRGWDNGAGVDTGRALLSNQAEGVDPSGLKITAGGSTSGGESSLRYQSGLGNIADRGNLVSSDDTETRPRNVALMYIINADGSSIGGGGGGTDIYGTAKAWARVSSNGTVSKEYNIDRVTVNINGNIYTCFFKEQMPYNSYVVNATVSSTGSGQARVRNQTVDSFDVVTSDWDGNVLALGFGVTVHDNEPVEISTGTSGAGPWERVGTTIQPKVATDKVEIGGGDIELNADGSADFAGDVTIGDYRPFSFTPTGEGVGIFDSGVVELVRYNNGNTAEVFRVFNTTGTDIAPDTEPTVEIKNDGSATFAGGDITLRADGRSYFSDQLVVGVSTSSGITINPNQSTGVANDGQSIVFNSTDNDYNGSIGLNRSSKGDGKTYSITTNGSLQLGGSENTYFSGTVSITTASGPDFARLQSDSNDYGLRLYRSSSLRAHKTEIQSLTDSVALVKALRPVTFKSAIESDLSAPHGGDLQVGFIAEEVEAIHTGLCTYGDGNLSGVCYDRMGAIAIGALKEALTRIEALEAEVQALKGGN